MKKISEHLGEIIVALACVALLITAITVFDAPISGFFNSIVDKETALGNQVMQDIEDIDVSNIGVAGGSGGEEGSDGGSEDAEDFINIDVKNEWTKLAGYNSNVIADPVAINASANSTYDVYYKIIETPMSIYCDATSNAYYAICVGANAQEMEEVSTSDYISRCDAPIRYRKSEDNLPTKDNPLIVEAGTLLAITVNKNDTDVLLYAQK